MRLVICQTGADGSVMRERSGTADRSPTGQGIGSGESASSYYRIERIDMNERLADGRRVQVHPSSTSRYQQSTRPPPTHVHTLPPISKIEAKSDAVRVFSTAQRQPGTTSTKKKACISIRTKSLHTKPNYKKNEGTSHSRPSAGPNTTNSCSDPPCPSTS